jgi:Integrase core domain
VTANPTTEWIPRQITEAFPWGSAPRYLIRDRDAAYGPVFVQRLRAMGIRDRPIAPRSPSQNAYVERPIGTIRRECLDHRSCSGRRTCTGNIEESDFRYTQASALVHPGTVAARRTPGATDNTSPRSPRSGGLRRYGHRPVCTLPEKDSNQRLFGQQSHPRLAKSAGTN